MAGAHPLGTGPVDTSDGLTVALHDLGGTGPALLVCHATGLCGRAYERLAAALTDAFHVWAVDFRGHGDSPAPADDDFSWDGMVRDAEAAAAAIGGGPIHAVGHSMGGAVALAVEARTPGTFATAYVYEPIVMEPDAVRPARNFLAEGARQRRNVFASREAALWRFAVRPPLNELESGSLAAYVQHGFADQDDGTVRLKCSGENEARTFEASGVITTTAVAPAALPTVVGCGAPDTPLAGMARSVAAALPAGELRAHPELGHFGPLQAPTVIGAEIRQHIEAVRCQGRHPAGR
ncbi:MAG: alpha/beta fold hydrolase [Mycobacteriales bacterium]